MCSECGYNFFENQNLPFCQDCFLRIGTSFFGCPAYKKHTFFCKECLTQEKFFSLQTMAILVRKRFASFWDENTIIEWPTKKGLNSIYNKLHQNDFLIKTHIRLN